MTMWLQFSWLRTAVWDEAEPTQPEGSALATPGKEGTA